MLNLDKLLINYMDSPSGVEREPVIGWKLSSDRRNVTQHSYRIRISESPSFDECVFDSGEVVSDESAHVRPKAGLKSIKRYYIRAEVTDDAGEKAAGNSSFITAYMDITEWAGEFITAEQEADKDESFGTLLRKEFYIDSLPQAAYFVGTAHGLYIPYLNGRKIGGDVLAPGWTSYNKHLLDQVYDISGELLPGANALGVSLGAGWYKGKMSYNLNRNHYGTRTAFGGCIILDYAGGRRVVIGSDASWKGSRSPILFSEIYDGETYDARLEQPGWNKPGFDDSAWSPVETVAQDVSVLAPTRGKGIRITDSFTPRLMTTPRGETVLDFGQNLSGWCRFKIESAPRGGKAVMRFFETLDADGNVYTANLRTAKQTVDYTCGGGDAEYQPSFTYHGFRYAQILEWPCEVCAEDFTALVLHTAMCETGSFVCSEPLLNQLQHNILWSMKGNSLDVPTDCPQRDERLGWTGDVQIFCSTAMFLMNAYSFYAKWLRDVAFDQTEDGAVAHIVPDIVSGKSDEDWLTKQGCSGASAWADVDIILPWNLYLTYGDTGIIRRQYESMKRWIDFMTAHSSEGCLFSYKLQFGDWVALDAEEGSYFGATPTAYTCAAFYCYSTRLFAKMAAVIDKTEDAAHYGSLADELRKSFNEHFVNPNGTLTVKTQTAHIVALHLDLVPDELRPKLAAELKRLLDANGGHLLTGFIGTPYFCHALSDNGYVRDAYSLLLKDDFPSWLYQVKKGATTVWEHWDGLKPDGTMWSPDMNSFNHYSYGSVGDWMYKDIGGLCVEEAAPGYKHFTIRPRMDSRIGWAELRYDSIYGQILSRWDRSGSAVSLKISVPANTGARVVLEDALCITATGGLNFSQDGGALCADAGSGTYIINYTVDIDGQ